LVDVYRAREVVERGHAVGLERGHLGERARRQLAAGRAARVLEKAPPQHLGAARAEERLGRVYAQRDRRPRHHLQLGRRDAPPPPPARAAGRRARAPPGPPPRGAAAAARRGPPPRKPGPGSPPRGPPRPNPRSGPRAGGGPPGPPRRSSASSRHKSASSITNR